MNIGLEKVILPKIDKAELKRFKDEVLRIVNLCIDESKGDSAILHNVGSNLLQIVIDALESELKRIEELKKKYKH